MSPLATNPLTGEPLDEQPTYREFAFYFLAEDGIGRFAISDHLHRYGFHWGKKLYVAGREYSEKETKRILALAQSKARQCSIDGSKPPMFMTEEGRSNLAKRGELDGEDFHAWRVCTVESLWQELGSLTLESKSIRTLNNLVKLEEETGIGIPLSFSFEPYPGSMGPEREGFLSLQGIAYACVPSEAPIVMQYLRGRGLIEEGVSVMIGTVVHITPQGYVVADSIEAGDAVVSHSGFLVCRFNGELDRVYEQVYRQVGVDCEPPCEVYRVKDVHHVDRIDDRIIAEIKKATVIVVDLTEHNFNVAFEAGYALSLDKPIVWTMQQPDGDLKLPFDIQSHNVLLYQPDQLDDFRVQLRFRILAALEKAKEQSRWRQR